jgi:chitinase
LVTVRHKGRSFTLENPSANHLGAKTVGEGAAGNYTKTPGFLSFYECCSLMNNPSWSSEWQNKSKSFYMFSGNQWVSFDDINSFRLRVKQVLVFRIRIQKMIEKK